MDNINKFIKGNPKYKGLKKPLEAAKVCDTARLLGDGRFEVISYREGLLTIGVSSSSQAADVQMQSTKIIADINKKLEQNIVKRIRYKLV